MFTNVSSDHLDLQGIHTLPELAEVKSTICRVTKPDGWVVLNADDPLVADRRPPGPGPRRLLLPRPRPFAAPRPPPAGRRARLRASARDPRRGDGDDEHEIVAVADLPVALGGLARHNVANALAAAGGARAMGASIAAGRRRPARLPRRPRSSRPAGSTCSGSGSGPSIVDFAHNEAGTAAILDVAAAHRRSGPRAGPAPVTAIIGTAGDRPDDTLRGIGRIAASKAQRVAIKETLGYLRGRDAPGSSSPRSARGSPRAASIVDRARLRDRGWGAARPNCPAPVVPRRRTVAPTRPGSSCCSATPSVRMSSRCSRGWARARSMRPTGCAISRRASRTSAGLDAASPLIADLPALNAQRSIWRVAHPSGTPGVQDTGLMAGIRRYALVAFRSAVKPLE